MVMEESLIQKLYYEKLVLNTEKHDQPIAILGDLYFKEQKNELPDLSNIRFAQGEVYFHNKDFEAAIFKWENIQNELEPWAKKNKADAYFELDLLETAEKIYQSIKTDSLTLNTEITLQLFGIYLAEQRKLDADQMIKQAVMINPDYPNVTKLARAFFEDQHNWSSSIELAVNEAMRTSSLNWFQILNIYVENGYTKSINPTYFIPAMSLLSDMDMEQFEISVVDLWLSYEQEETYLSWICEASQLILETDFNHEFKLRRLPTLLQETYMDLISGKYYIVEIQSVVPDLLKAWMKIADSSTAFYASASLLAWEDIFPNSLEKEEIEKAEFVLSNTHGDNSLMEEMLDIFKMIEKKAFKQQIEVDQFSAWMINRLAEFGNRRVLIGGSPESEKLDVITTIIGQEAKPSNANAETILYRYGSNPSVQAVTEVGIIPLASQFDVNEVASNPNTIIDIAVDKPLFDNKQMAIVHLPNYNWSSIDDNVIPDSVRLADNILYILNDSAPFSSNELTNLLNMKEKNPGLQVDFILKLSAENGNDQESSDLLNDTKKHIKDYFPGANLVSYSTTLDKSNELDKLSRFLQKSMEMENWRHNRITNTLYYMKQTLIYLAQQQIRIEEELSNVIDRDEDILSKIQGSIHQLHDMEEDKKQVIQEAYQAIKIEIKTEFVKNIPNLIKGSSDIIKEDSDFRNIHLELNEEMNKKINLYIQNNVMPIYISSLQDWITFAQNELTLSQEQLTEWEHSFNTLLGEDRIQASCDFQILNDWQRDADRMTSSFDMEQENIILRRTPSQVLLKGAGKLFGAMPINNKVLANAYKSFIVNEDYQEVTESISRKFFLQFELFEKAIARDIHIFYREPFSVLEHAVAELNSEKEKNQADLLAIRSNPEVFRDPLTLFEVRIRQYEWMNYADQVKIEARN
ncbi:GTP-binding protein [Bacillus sp. FSL K6-3431]|uniref:GTP-binding protein n=1 Tax=Bacillus sp. FSL K6-3431 TaxID=2921500 RepID=UPI0030FD031C